MPDLEEHYARASSIPRCAGYLGLDQHDRIAALYAEARKVTTAPGSRGSQIQNGLFQIVFDKVQ
jgi:hypothetical protein